MRDRDYYRFLEICAFCQTPTWCIRKHKGPMCLACRVVRFYRNVLYKPKGIDLLPWQERGLRKVYGTVDIDTGKRLVRLWYEEVAKKNGKSFRIGGMPLFHLVEEREVERAEAYGCAAAKDQAGIVFRAAVYFAADNPLLRDHLKIVPSVKRILRRDGSGFYSVISADGDLQDGIEPSLALMDELHRWRTAKAHTLYDVVMKGTISREEPLVAQITTAGEVSESPICYRQHERAKRILSGEDKSTRMYVAIYAADAERIKNDPEYWKSREARVAANPSHEDLGGFLKDADIAAQMEEGRASYLRYHLNIWGQMEDRWLQTGEWARGARETRPLIGRPLTIGLDLSTTTDFTALVHLFPDESDLSYDVQAHFWVPRDRVSDLKRRLHIPLDRWIDLGLVTATEGDVVDYAAVEAHIEWASENFELQEICYDPWNATDLVNRLTGKGYRCEKVPQTVTHLSAPMKHIHRKLLEGKLRHGNNEVLNWMANNVVARTDPNGNIAPKKPDLAKDSYRIDGFAALVTAMGRGMLAEMDDVSVSFLTA